MLQIILHQAGVSRSCRRTRSVAIGLRSIELFHSVLESRCVPRAERLSLFETTVIACEADVIAVGALTPVSQRGDHGSIITPAIATEGPLLSTSDLETDNRN